MNLVYLQNRLIYSVVVAGKSATFTDKVLGRWEAHCQNQSSFDFIRILIAEDNLEWVIRDIRCGNYTKIAKCFRELAASDLDLPNCTPEQLETIHGIGPKTARFFILHFVNDQARCAALDVHVLRWMREEGYDAPRGTPTGKKYRELEVLFLAEADKRGVTPKDLDSQIWLHYSKYEGEVPRP